MNEIVASAALIQGAIIWIIARIIIAIIVGRKFNQKNIRENKTHFSTSHINLDRYMLISTVAIGSFITLIVSMLIEQDVFKWSAPILFFAMIAADAAAIRSIIISKEKENIDPFEILDKQ